MAGQLDYETDDRRARYIAIGGTAVGLIITATLIYSLFFHSTEPDDRFASTTPTQATKGYQPGTASRLVAARVGPRGRIAELPIQGGVGVLVDNHLAFWVKGNRIYALNGLAKSTVPELEYGPPGLSSEDLRRALAPHVEQPAVPLEPPNSNPLGNDVHDVLRRVGYIAHGGDVTRSVNVWKHRDSDATITGTFEGEGNGMFYRTVRRLKMERNGFVVWEADRVQIRDSALYVDQGGGWERVDVSPNGE